MALPADVVKRGGVRDDLYIVDGLYLRIRAVPALLSSVVFAGVRADWVRFGIRKCDLWAGDATRSAGELSVVGCRSGCGESCCHSYPDGTALWRDDEAGDVGQREGTLWLDVYYRNILFADAFELQVSETEHGGTYARNEAD